MMSIRFLVPLVGVLIAAVTAFAGYNVLSRTLSERIVASSSNSLDFLARIVQGEINDGFRRNDLAGVQLSLSNIQFAEDIRFAFIATRQGEIVLSTDRAWTGRQLSDLQKEGRVDADLSVSEGASAAKLMFDDNGVDTAMYSVSLPAEYSSSMGRGEDGVLVIGYDISAKLESLRADILGITARNMIAVLLVMALLLIGLHFLITRRVSRVLGAADAYLQGDENHKTNVSGPDEIGCLARALDQVTDAAERARMSLKAREADLRVAQRIAGLGSLSINMNDGTILWSPDSAVALGVLEDALPMTRNDFLALMNQEEVANTLSGLDDCLACGVPLRSEIRLKNFPEGERIFLFSAEAADTDIVRCVLLDITERKAALIEAKINLEKRVAERTAQLQDQIAQREATQRDLKESQAKLRSMFDTVADAMLVIDTKATILEFNPAAEKMFGWHADEVLGQNMKILVPADIRPMHDRMVAGFSERRDSGAYELNRDVRGIRKDGEEFLMELAIRRNEVKGEVFFIGVARDISEKRKAEQRLQEQERQLRATLENMPGAILFTDPDLKIIVANDAMARMFDLPPELIAPGQRYDEVIRKAADKLAFDNERDKQRYIESRIDELKRGEQMVIEHAMTDGRFIEARRRASDDGGVVTTIMDVTARKNAESALVEAQRSLVEAEKMAALGNLVAGVAHEVNTPVGIGVTASSHLELAVADFRKLYEAGAMRRSDLEDFLETCGKSAHIIEQNLHRASDLIKSFKQVAVDQTEDSEREFALAEYVEEILTSLRPNLKHRPIKVETDIPSEIKLVCSPGALAQILTNLVMNSLKHGFELEQAGRISITAHRNGPNIQIHYEDDGAGMDKDTTARIFDPFFTTKRGSGGSGLGMHIVYNLVTRKLGGTITCESSPGDGARFDLRVPVASQAIELKERTDEHQ